MAIFLITQRLSFSGGDLWRFYQGISYTSKETAAISCLDAQRLARIRGRTHENEA